MIITFQICCAVMTACMMGLYYPGKKLYTTANTVFSKILFSLMAACLFDTALSYSFLLQSVSFFVSQSDAFEFVTIVLSKMRMSCVVAFVINIYEYNLIGVRTRSLYHKIASVLLIMIPILIPGQTIRVYYWISLLIIVSLFIMLMFFVHRYWDSMYQLKVKITVVFFIVWLTAEIISTVLSIDSLSCIIGVIGTLLMFYYVENPKSKIDGETGLYTLYFMKEYLSTISYLHQSVHIGALYAKLGNLDISLLYSFLDDDIYFFKDTNELIYVVSMDEAKVEHVINGYRKEGLVLALIYEHDDSVTFDNLRTYIRQYCLSFDDKMIHYISTEDVMRLDEDEKVRMDIIHALVEDRILTYIQPIYSLRESRFVAGECLCRMQKRNGEIIPPSKFIPIAERTGLVVNIESVMFRNLCRCLADDKLKVSSIRYLDINLSVKKGEQNDLVEEYNKIRSEYDIDANKINLEITETDSVSEKTSILNNMNTMTQQGFRFALDDFGTGESNLGYIIDMPVSVIKFDKEITQKAMADNKAWLVVKNVIDMAHDLNLEVVVEGVEDEKQLNSCKQLNADYIQGYYFSKPLPVDEFLEYILSH